MPDWPPGPGFGGKRRALTVADLIQAYGRGDEDAIALMEMIADSTRELAPTPLEQAALLKARVPLSVRTLLDGRQLTVAGLVDLAEAGVHKDELRDLLTLLGLGGRPSSAQALKLLRAGFSAEELREMRSGDHDHPPVPYARGGRPGAPLAFMLARKSTPAVDRALAWLAAMQADDGRWDSSGDRNSPLGRIRYGGRLPAMTTAETALALLAFLGAGHGPDSVRYGAAVRRGLVYLMRQQQPDGRVGPPEHRAIPHHAAACLALCEAYGMTGSPRLGGAARLALRALLRGQDAKSGGWPQAAGAKPDIRSTSWAAEALAAGLLCGCAPGSSREALGRAADFAAQLTNDQGVTGHDERPRNGYQRETSERLVDAQLKIDARATHDRSHAPTAAALALRALDGALPSAEARRGVGRLTIGTFAWKPPARRARGTIDCLLAYQGARAIWHLRSRSGQAWSTQLRAAIRAAQLKKAVLDGSWQPSADAWGNACGGIVVTALNALTLLAETRYPQQLALPKDR